MPGRETSRNESKVSGGISAKEPVPAWHVSASDVITRSHSHLVFGSPLLRAILQQTEHVAISQHLTSQRRSAKLIKLFRVTELFSFSANHTAYEKLS